MLVGVMSGAVTNTPGLGAAQEALKQAFEAGQLAEIPQIALGYAVAYPLAVVGIILSMVVIRLMFRINIEQEEQALEASGEVQADKPEIMTLRLTNKALSGRKLHEIKDLVGRSFVISRMMRQGHYSIPGWIPSSRRGPPPCYYCNCRRGAGYGIYGGKSGDGLGSFRKTAGLAPHCDHPE